MLYLSFTVYLFVPFTYTFIMATIIDKTEIQQKEIVLSFFYFITRSSVMLFIATFVPMRYYAIQYILPGICLIFLNLNEKRQV